MILPWAAIAMWPFAYSQANSVSPWADGQDLEQFYQQYCLAPDLEKHYFPLLDSKQMEGLTKLISEVLWADNSDNLLGIKGAATTAVVAKMRALRHPIAPAFDTMIQQATEEPMHSKYLYLHSVNVKQRDQALESFEKLATTNAQLAGAMLTVLNCRIIRNVKTMDPLVANRVAQVNGMNLTIKTAAESPPKTGSGGGYSDSDCGCGGGNFCYGPRGGHYCITSGGNKRYVKH
ncbi:MULTISPECIES: hypothetical protein [Pseudomonas syringae group]|uniref:hypothetical protein n=1 Tax=Pseudomonas syringae group TaxID=136849 RepID=UPI002016A695|nr:hypothetical protein [Pseudomonas viridiflava]